MSKFASSTPFPFARDHDAYSFIILNSILISLEFFHTIIAISDNVRIYSFYISYTEKEFNNNTQVKYNNFN